MNTMIKMMPVVALTVVATWSLANRAGPPEKPLDSVPPIAKTLLAVQSDGQFSIDY